jgi:SAM-dependent methyltransferase
MAGEATVRGAVFDDIAEDYDRHRPAYPQELVDRACGEAGLARGAEVLEVGCGTGQLTRSLLARGLRVTALEPGERLLARARDRLGNADLELVNVRLEQATLPAARYRAAFAASSIHWVDPDLSWRSLADALADGGTLALLSYFGMADPRSAGDQRALRAALQRVAPEAAVAWPAYRDLDGIRAGVERRRHNISEAWAWLGGYDIGRGYAADLFEDVELLAVPALVEHTADELNALVGTMSFWARLAPGQREALSAGNRALERRLGRPIRSSIVACLVTARRSGRSGM